MTTKERSLNEALVAVGLQRIGLPKQWRDESDGFWIEALVLVRKRNGDKSYMLAKRGADRVIRYTRDFGRMSQFVSLISIHPYKYLDSEHLTDCGDSEEDKKKYLAAITDKPIEDVQEMSQNEVEEAINEQAITRQLENRDMDIAEDKKRALQEASKGENGGKTYEQEQEEEHLQRLAAQYQHDLRKLKGQASVKARAKAAAKAKKAAATKKK